MTGSTIKFYFRQEDLDNYGKYINNLPAVVKQELNDEIKPLKQKTKQIVKHKLTKGHGVQKGIYKKHIVIKTLDTEPGHVHFQVGGNKGHYRLTHLLENGHRIKMLGVFLNHNTKKVEHIAPGQDYADKHVIMMMKKAIKKATKKGK